MLTRKRLIEFCLTFPGAYEDYPFDENASVPDAWTVMRHRENRKSFALLFDRNGRLNLNVKCEPMAAGLLRCVYPSVIPAYHMNKEHWNGVIVDGTVPEREILVWISQSYDLTKPRRKTKSS